MIAIDTNVLVRLLVNDDAVQAAKARRFFDAQADKDGSIWVSDTVVIELIWVLAKAYGRQRSDLLVALRALSAHATLSFESPLAVQRAIETFAVSSADFADCLLAEKAKQAGCGQLVTFDRGMRALAGVKLL